MTPIKFISEDTTIGVTRFPDRKAKCLYKMVGNYIVPLAYFRSDEAAAEFEKFFNRMIDAMTLGPAKPDARLPHAD